VSSSIINAAALNSSRPHWHGDEPPSGVLQSIFAPPIHPGEIFRGVALLCGHDSSAARLGWIRAPEKASEPRC